MYYNHNLRCQCRQIGNNQMIYARKSYQPLILFSSKEKRISPLPFTLLRRSGKKRKGRRKKKTLLKLKTKNSLSTFLHSLCPKVCNSSISILHTQHPQGERPPLDKDGARIKYPPILCIYFLHYISVFFYELPLVAQGRISYH